MVFSEDWSDRYKDIYPYNTTHGRYGAPPVGYEPDRTMGKTPGHFFGIASAVVDPTGVVIAADAGLNTVSFFFPNGTFAGRMGSRGSEPGEFLSLGRLIIFGQAYDPPENMIVPFFESDNNQNGSQISPGNYTTSRINDYYRSILEMSNREWHGGLRSLHGEDQS